MWRQRGQFPASVVIWDRRRGLVARAESQDALFAVKVLGLFVASPEKYSEAEEDEETTDPADDTANDRADVGLLCIIGACNRFRNIDGDIFQAGRSLLGFPSRKIVLRSLLPQRQGCEDTADRGADLAVNSGDG